MAKHSWLQRSRKSHFARGSDPSGVGTNRVCGLLLPAVLSSQLYPMGVATFENQKVLENYPIDGLFIIRKLTLKV